MRRGIINRLLVAIALGVGAGITFLILKSPRPSEAITIDRTEAPVGSIAVGQTRDVDFVLHNADDRELSIVGFAEQ
jgi:hypothetical protein